MPWRYARYVKRVPGADPRSDVWVGRVPRLPGCAVVGRSRTEVIQALERRAAERLEGLLRAGVEPPPGELPEGFKEIFGDG